jgi:L-lactate dehydrogenase complex protein LldG
MKTDGQETFIRNIRTALGYPPDQRRTPPRVSNDEIPTADLERLARIEKRTRSEKIALLEQMQTVAKPLNLNILPMPDIASVSSSIIDLVAEKETEWGEAKQVAVWQHPLTDQLHLTEALKAQNVSVYVTKPADKHADSTVIAEKKQEVRREVIDSYIGITSADFCIAVSGTLVMKTRAGQGRSVSLVPAIHIAVIHLDQLLASLKELYSLLKYDPAHRKEGLTNCMSLVSGPSKTADIELVMVHGAHGPRELYIYVITDIYNPQ